MIALWLWVALVGFVVSACAPVDKGSWWKPGVTREAFARDDYECRRENVVTSYRSGVIGGIRHTVPDTDVDEDMYNRCMQAREYQVVPKGFVPPK